MNNTKQLIIGLVGMVSTIWGSAWILHLVDDTWMEFPVWATAFIIFLAAFIAAMTAIDRIAKKEL